MQQSPIFETEHELCFVTPNRTYPAATFFCLERLVGYNAERSRSVRAQIVHDSKHDGIQTYIEAPQETNTRRNILPQTTTRTRPDQSSLNWTTHFGTLGTPNEQNLRTRKLYTNLIFSTTHGGLYTLRCINNKPTRA